MRFRPSFLGVFAVILSCGPAIDGPPDTPVVGARTHAEGIPLAADAASTLVGFSGARFAVLDSGDGTVVFDALSRTAFRVAGRAVRTPYLGSDMWMDVNLTGNEPPSKLEASGDGRRILVRTERGIEALDLASAGVSLATSGVDASTVDADADADATGATEGGATMAPDGESFVTWNDAAATVVRIADGSRVVHPFTPAGYAEPTFRWTSRSVSFTDATGASIVDRATWRVQHVAVENATLVVSKDGAVAAVHGSGAPAVVEIWRIGETRPAARIASAFVSNLIMDEAGSKVAWVEHSGDVGAGAHLHTLDIGSGTHARFAAQAAHCELSPENLIAIENGELRTDGECSPGCPSFSRQPDYLAYDFAHGNVLRHWMGDAEPPYNDELSVRSFAAAQLAKRYGFDSKVALPVVHHPSSDVVLVARGDGLQLAGVVSGEALVTLRGSAGFPASSAHFSPDSGALVIGARTGEIVVWEAATGNQVWTTTR
jgi:hypothetical protein